MKIYKPYSFLLLIFFSASAIAQQQPDYSIYSVKQKRTISLAALVGQVKNANVILFGEEHNDAVGHAIQAGLFKLLHQANDSALVLSMELFETDVQPILDEFTLGLISEKGLMKDARAWKNYADYKPLLDFAQSQKLKVLAANTPSRYTNVVTRKGLKALDSLSAESKRYLPPLPVDTLTGPYYQKFVNEMGGHGMGSMQIYQSQNLWDATMANSILMQLQKAPESRILHISGRFHTDDGLGITARLRKVSATGTVTTISCFADSSFAGPEWKKYSGLADYVIITKPGTQQN